MSVGLTVDIAGDISDLRKAFAGAVRGAIDTGEQIASNVGNAATKLGASFKVMGDQAKAAFDKTAQSQRQVAGLTEDNRKALAGMALGAGVGFAAGAFAIRGFVNAASNVEETANLIDVAFGKNAASVRSWAAEYSRAASRSEQDMLEFAGGVQAMLAPMLGTNAATAQMSTNLAGLATDLSSFFFNVADADAMQALKGALIGNAEGVRRFGVVMTESAMAAYAQSQGIKVSYDKMNEASKVALRYQFIMSQTSQVQGDAARTSDSYSNTMRGLTGVAKDLRAQMGAALLPAITSVSSGMRSALSSFRAMPDSVKAAAATTVALSTGFLGLVATAGAVASAVPKVTAGFKALQALASATGGFLSGSLLPVLPLLVAVEAAVGGIVLAVGAMRIAWEGDLGGIRSGIRALCQGIPKAFGAAIAWVKKAWSQSVDWIAEKFIYATSIMKFESPEQAAAKVSEYKNRGMGMGDALERAGEHMANELRTAWDYAGGVGESIWQGGREVFNSGRDALMQSFREGKLTFAELLKGLGKGGATRAAAGKAAAAATAPTYDFAGKAESPEEHAKRIKELERERLEYDKKVEDAIREEIEYEAKFADQETQIAQAAADRLKKQQEQALETRNTAKDSAKEYFESDAGKRAVFEAQGVGTQLATAAASVGRTVLEGMGTVGTAFSAAAQGMLTGGPVAAAMAGLGSILTESQGFQGLMQVINNILGNLMQALNPFFEALSPLVEMVAQILAPVAKLIGVLGNIFKLIVTLEPILKILQIAVQGIATVINAVAKAIAWVVNGIIEGIAWILETALGWLPWIGDDISSFANELRKSQIDLSQFDESVEDAGKAMMEPPEDAKTVYDPYLDTVEKVNEALTNVPNGFKVALARFNATLTEEAGLTPTLAAYTGGLAGGGSQKMTTNNVSMMVQSNDPDMMYKGVKRQMELANFRATGSTQLGGPNSVQRTA